MQISKRHKSAISTAAEEDVYITLIRAPMMPMLICDSGKPMVLRRFVNPMLETLSHLNESNKTLGCRMRNLSQSLPGHSIALAFREDITIQTESEDDVNVEQIQLWGPEDGIDPDTWKPVYVDKILCPVLRPHQAEGVRFLFNSLMGLNGESMEGCILADDMGLGKTLQSIAILWTLLNNNIRGESSPAVRRALVLCPSSLVQNWSSELEKWTKGKCMHVAVSETTRDKVIGQFTSFRYSFSVRVLICSYEAFRIHKKLVEDSPIDLIVCDEAHRLKNEKTQISACIANLPARKRLLLTGTPIQNDMAEFFSMISLALPGLSMDDFSKKFALPISRARDPDATDKERCLGASALADLSELSSKFILRRTNSLLSKLLPRKNTFILFCALTKEQRTMYSCVSEWVLGESSKSSANRALRGSQLMLKICCHPSLVEKSCFKVGEPLEKYEPEARPDPRVIQPQLSGKLSVLLTLLTNFQRLGDKCIVISLYTSFLEVVDRICSSINISTVTLDGTINIKKRFDIVTSFNAKGRSTVMLLSSKAGGCGLNLIGANRLVMLDADWNPASDKQAMARIWREGQEKECWIYRLFSTGTIEEKVLQRQINKDGLTSSLVHSTGATPAGLKEGLSMKEMRNLFSLKPPDVISDTLQVLKCRGCSSIPEKTPSEFVEENLLTWAHIVGGDIGCEPRLINDGGLGGVKGHVTMAMYSTNDCQESSTKSS